MDPKDTFFSMPTVWPLPPEIIPRIKLCSILSTITFDTNVRLFRIDHNDAGRVVEPLVANKLKAVIEFLHTQTDNYLNWTVDRIFYDFPYHCIGIEITNETEDKKFADFVNQHLYVPKERDNLP